jgi:hypothetical protein
MPARNPEAVRRRAVDTARRGSGQPAAPILDPVFVALNPAALPARERSPAELYQWVRRDKEYTILGANVVVELNSESRGRRHAAPRPGHRIAGRAGYWLWLFVALVVVAVAHRILGPSSSVVSWSRTTHLASMRTD